MKKEYYSMVIPGLERPVEQMLHKTGGISLNRMLPGAAVYRSVKEPVLPFVQRTFMLLSEMRPEADINAALKRLSATDAWMDRFDFEECSGKRFRIVPAENGQPVSGNPRFISLIEKSICEQAGMMVNRDHPQVELWVNRRAEGVYFLWRLRQTEGKNADPLRRDLCEILAFLSSPQGGQAAILGLTGSNLPDALLSQGASGIQAVYADHMKLGNSSDRNARMRILKGTPGSTGIEPQSQQTVMICLAPKGSFSIREEDLRSALHEANGILKSGGKLTAFYPKSAGRAFRRISELELLDDYTVQLSGEECRAEVWRKP